MYRAFNLTNLTTGFFGSNYDACKIIGGAQTQASKSKIKATLERFTGVDGTIDGSKLQDHWFPDIAADIFISHSHADTELATALAGWLLIRFKVTSFIDSCVWGYSDNLLQAIDDKYCPNDDGKSYNYHKRNNSTSHVHMMLATALGKMIDKAECLIFINTPNSINTSDIEEPETHSPWLLFELGLASIIKRENLRRKGLRVFSESKTAEDLAIKYTLTKELEKLHPVTTSTLRTWRAHHQESPTEHALDTLYELTKQQT